MFSKNIIFKNFNGKKNKLQKKFLNNIFKKENLLKKYSFLYSLTENYIYSYKKKTIKQLKKFSSFNLIGMGGSILGSEAIYNFFVHVAV